MLEKDIEVRFSAKQLSFEYKLLEYRLIVNKELYDEKVIDLRTYNEMENSIMGRLRKIRNEYLLNEKDDRIPAIVSEELWDKAKALHERKKYHLGTYLILKNT